jgi:hypothetical protein
VFIIIKRIPAEITLEDLEHFVLPIIQAEFATKHGTLKSLQIIGLQDKKAHPVERYALIRIGPDSIVTPLIKSLTHGTLHNSRYVIDQYYVRHWHNDRRANKTQHLSYTHNKRKEERRRLDLKRTALHEKLFVTHPE